MLKDSLKCSLSFVKEKEVNIVDTNNSTSAKIRTFGSKAKKQRNQNINLKENMS